MTDNRCFEISIIIPTFNSENHIQRCLLSVLAQTKQGVEILIQDGGSSDKTLDIIAAFKESNPHAELNVAQEKDAGAYDAMNRAMQRARGRWLYFLGSDDELFDATVLSRMLDRPEAPNSNVIYGNALIVGDTSWAKDGQLYDGRFTRQKLLQKNICHQAIFYKRDFIASIGRYDLKYPICADWDLNLRCWSRTNFSYVNETVARFYAGGISSAPLGDRAFGADKKSKLQEYFGRWYQIGESARRFLSLGLRLLQKQNT